MSNFIIQFLQVLMAFLSPSAKREQEKFEYEKNMLMLEVSKEDYSEKKYKSLKKEFTFQFTYGVILPEFIINKLQNSDDFYALSNDIKTANKDLIVGRDGKTRESRHSIYEKYIYNVLLYGGLIIMLISIYAPKSKMSLSVSIASSVLVVMGLILIFMGASMLYRYNATERVIKAYNDSLQEENKS